MSDSYTPLRVAALRMRNAEPQAFADFVVELERWVSLLLLGMTEAPPDAIFLAQGQARAARALLRVFNECHLQSPKKPGAT